MGAKKQVNSQESYFWGYTSTLLPATKAIQHTTQALPAPYKQQKPKYLRAKHL